MTVTLPAALRLERAKDNPALVSVFFGPVLLAGELGRDNMLNDRGDKDAYLKTPAVAVPEIASAAANPAHWLATRSGRGAGVQGAWRRRGGWNCLPSALRSSSPALLCLLAVA